jgi:hypothetical protein
MIGTGGSRLGSAARLSLVALVASFVLAPLPAHAAFPGANGKIIFDRLDQTCCGPGNGLRTVNPDGTGLSSSLLVYCFESRCRAAWSPSGQKIAFDRAGGTNPDSEQPCCWEIYTMNADGTGVTNLTNNTINGDGPDDLDPTWSPDGTKIAFNSGRDPVGIYVMDADGSNPTHISSGSQPAWSPDGTKIAFRYSTQCPFCGISVQNPDGTGQTRLSAGDGDATPVWSPDGRKIAFKSGRDGNGEIYVMNADGTNQTNITNNPAADNYPAWSPDGTKIAFTRDLIGCCRPVFTMNPDGTGQTATSSVPSTYDDFVDWQPIPVANYPHPQSASQLSVSLVPAFKQCGTGANPSNAEHSPPLATSSCNPPKPGSAVALVGPTSQPSAAFTVTPGDSDPTNGNQANLSISAGLTDIQSTAGGDYNPNASGADLTAVTRLRITDKANGYGGLPATATEFDFKVPTDCSSTADPSVGSSCSANTTANALVPGLIQEQRQTVVQAFRVRIDDSGANGIRGDSDDRIFMTQGLFAP